MAVAWLLLILFVVTVAGVWGVDSREGGDRSSRGAGGVQPSAALRLSPRARLGLRA